MNKASKISAVAILILFISFIILGVYIVKSDILQEIFKGNSEVIDTGWFNFTYGYNSTTQTMTNWDGLSFQTNQNGVITVKKDTGILSYFGFALTGKINGENQIKTSEDFTWTWSMKQEGDNYTFTAYNNYPNFNWTQIYYFYPNKSMKIKHILTNKLGVTIENTKMWYIHTIEENELIIFNDTEYKLNLTEDKYFQGNFNNLLPKIEMKDKYFFNYSDIIDNEFDITDIFIGNGSIVQHPDVYIMAIGFTKGSGNFPDNYKIEIDPTIEIVESTNDVGKWSSIALDSTEVIHISYYDTTNTGLRYCNNSGGNWSCVAVETINDTGRYSSIAIDSNNIVHISHYDFTNDDLRYCNNSGGSWSCVAVDTTNIVGVYSSIAIDSNNIVHISHRDNTNDDLRYCNNSGGSWSCIAVDTTNDVGRYSSIAIDSNNIVHISHHQYIANDLRYCNNSGGNWSCIAVDTPNNVAQYSSIAIDSNNIVHISHDDYTNHDLRYCNNSGGSWSCIAVDTTNDVGQYSSIAVSTDDSIYISEYDRTRNFLRLCNKTTSDWSCQDITNTSGNIEVYGRGLVIKKGVISTSTTSDGFAHMSFYNGSSDLGYAKIDISNISIILNTPTNNSWNNSLTINFTCNFTSSAGTLKNVTFYAWNSTSVINNTENQSISGSSNSSTFTIILPRDDSYLWNCYTCDTGDDCAFADSNFTLNIDTTFPLISITSPTNNSNQSNNGLDINYTVSDINLDSCWYSNDTMSSNTTLTCGTNITTITWAEGQHNVTIWANDSANNVNSSQVTFTIDTINPTINFTSPTETNNSYLSRNYVLINVTSTDTNLKNITINLYNSTSNLINSTFVLTSPNYQNISGLANGIYYFNATSRDIANNQNNTETRQVTIDTINPLISYGTGTENDNTNFSRTWIYVNVSLTETNFANITFTLRNDSGNVNSTTFTVVTYTINWTGLADNNYSYFINITDSANNQNSTLVRYITLDTTPPSVTIAEPQANTNYANNNSMSLNYSVSDVTTSVNTCWYNVYLVSPYLIAISNTTISNCLNTTFSLQGGDEDYELNFYANDTVNNINKTTFNFGIRTTSPAISLNAPSNNQYLNNETNVYFNFTATDSDGLSSCRLYGNWTGTWHINYTWISPTNATMNYTTVNISEGVYKYNVWCNDTVNNDDFSSINRTFTIDTTNPEVNITTSNASTFTSLSLTINFNISDTNIDICYFTVRNSSGDLHNYAENTSVSCSATSREISTLVYGTFTFELWGEDLANNLNSDIITFITTAPSAGAGGGGGAVPPPTIIEVISNRTFCGDGTCQDKFPGNDLNITESFYNCPQDCPGFNVDSAIFFCFDDDPETLCFWDQLTAKYVGLFFGIFIALLSFTTVEEPKTKKQITLFRYTAHRFSRKRRKRAPLSLGVGFKKVNVYIPKLTFVRGKR